MMWSQVMLKWDLRREGMDCIILLEISQTHPFLAFDRSGSTGRSYPPCKNLVCNYSGLLIKRGLTLIESTYE